MAEVASIASLSYTGGHGVSPLGNSLLVCPGCWQATRLLYRISFVVWSGSMVGGVDQIRSDQQLLRDPRRKATVRHRQ